MTNDQFHFSFPCPICGSQLDCQSDNIGGTTKCPDCESVVAVPEPSAEQRRAAGVRDANSIDLSLAVESEVRAPSPTSSVFRDNAAAILAKATKELDDEEKKERENVGDRDFRRILAIFKDPQAFIRVIFLGLFAGGLLAGVKVAATNLMSQQTAMWGFFVGMPTFLAGVAWLSVLGANGIALLNGAASGSEKEVDWPALSPMESFLQSLYVMNAMLYAVMPAAVIGLLVGNVMGSILAALGVMWVGFLGMLLVFPVILLSTLFEESLFKLYSTRIGHSLRVGQRYVMTFLQLGVVLAFLASGVLLVWQSTGLWSSLPVALLLTFFFLLYFRALGWLAWRCDQANQAGDDATNKAT